MSIPFILASASRPRRDLLFKAGVSPTVRVSDVDEPAALRAAADLLGISVDDIPAEERVLILSQAKARAVARVYEDVKETAAQASGERLTVRPLEADPGPTSQSIPDVLTDDPGLEGLDQGPFILGCDSMFELGGNVYGKPHDAETARERLKLMRGNRGVLWTGHTLIDLATGREERAVSSAQVSFADFTDVELEAYLATGEPLEVAGSFTLEGFGGAFIDSIAGDPHGVIGLSLPLLRTLFTRFEVSWPDLWNVARTDHVNDFDDDSTPVGNVHQPGDGWIDCACGRRHWGLNGASGVLLARRDPETGKVTHIVLQHRSAWSAEGGTWGTPGGATADGENALEGALRESYEEANLNPEDMEVVGSYREDHGPWSYTTVFAFEKPGHTVHPVANDDESTEVEWVPLNDVASHKLLTAFGHDWSDFVTRLHRLAAEHPLA